MWSKNVLRGRISGCLFELANIPFQKDLWTNKVKNLWGDSTELLADLGAIIGDGNLLHFKAEGYISDEEEGKLLKLDKFLLKITDNYFQDGVDNEVLWKSSDWKFVSEIAKDLYCHHFENDEFIYFKEHIPDSLEMRKKLKMKYPLE